MPIEVKAYLCKYRCGYSARMKYKSVENHEKTCFGNPERKACRTCKFWEFDYDSRSRFCLIFEDERGSKNLQYNCTEWKQAEVKDA